MFMAQKKVNILFLSGGLDSAVNKGQRNLGIMHPATHEKIYIFVIFSCKD